MTEAEKNTQHAAEASGAGRSGGTSSSELETAASPGSGRGDTPGRSETGVMLGAGEPNTFEPEESDPAPQTPAE